MLLTITTAAGTDGDNTVPATDLGYVLHKHPDNVRAVSTAAGTARVFWPEAGQQQATVATMVEVDPVGLVRRGGAQPLAAYVNDRPYVASSFLSVAIGRLFRSAMNGDCPNHPHLVDVVWPISVHLPAVPIGGDRRIVEQLFSPLGYRCDVEVPLLDAAFAEWGSAAVANVTLSGSATMRDLLRHLYVLLPVLDNDKHYWIDEGEVAKLLRHGEGWLGQHPEYQFIARRYLGNFRGLTQLALDQLAEQKQPAKPNDDSEASASEASDSEARDLAKTEGRRPNGEGTGLEPLVDERAADADEASIESPLSLNAQRMAAVVDAVVTAQASTVVDLGCGEGNLLQHLAEEKTIDRLVGADVAISALRRAERRLDLARRPERQKPSIELRHSSLTYRDPTLNNFDAACLVEVIEHLDPPRLDAVEPILFRHARPKTVIVSTPNRDYNVLFNLPIGTLRHQDHRFEWTRAEFAQWCERMAESYGYRFAITPIGPQDPEHGAPTQMAVLTRQEPADG